MANTGKTAMESKKTIARLENIRKKNPKCIIAICYNEAFVFSAKCYAKSFFVEGMLCSEGSEHERYSNLYSKIDSGLLTINDSEDWDGNQIPEIVRGIVIKGSISE